MPRKRRGSIRRAQRYSNSPNSPWSDPKSSWSFLPPSLLENLGEAEDLPSVANVLGVYEVKVAV